MTTASALPNRVALNFRAFGLNYALVGLMAGILRVCLDPTLLFLTGSVLIGWGMYLQRFYEKLKIPEVFFFRGIGAASFLVLCLVGPAALSFCFGVGGSVAVAHACLRQHAGHKHDDEVVSRDDPEAGRVDADDKSRSLQASTGEERPESQHESEFADPESSNAGRGRS